VNEKNNQKDKEGASKGNKEVKQLARSFRGEKTLGERGLGECADEVQLHQNTP